MSEQELNLFEFAAGSLAQPRAGPAQIVGSEVPEGPAFLAECFHDMPDGLNRNAIASGSSQPIDPSEYSSFFDSSRGDPAFQLLTNPVRYWNRPGI